MAEDGFLSRFLIVTSLEERAPRTKDEQRVMELEPGELEKLRALLGHCIPYQIPVFMPEQTRVEYESEGVEAKVDAFEEGCRRAINSTDNNFIRAIYNRAHLKSLILMSLFAVSDNHMRPRISGVHAVCGISIVERDIAVCMAKFNSGDIGGGDHSRTRKLVAILREYLGGAPAAGYKVNEKMHRDYVIPRSYMQIRTSQLTQFTEHKMGATAALEQTIRAFAASGYFKEIEKAKAMQDYNYRGQCYMIVDLPIHRAP
jgi:hypothetical protein